MDTVQGLTSSARDGNEPIGVNADAADRAVWQFSSQLLRPSPFDRCKHWNIINEFVRSTAVLSAGVPSIPNLAV
ncbi:MAG: hypothetical protein H6R21_2296 [Proteobacteria bacterium]|nr:hypothetical protein [Pseudomonadota bacterium]